MAFKSAGGSSLRSKVIKFHSHVLGINLRCTCKNLLFFFFQFGNLNFPVTTCGGDKRAAQGDLKIKTKVMFADLFVGSCAICRANISHLFMAVARIIRTLVF